MVAWTDAWNFLLCAGPACLAGVDGLLSNSSVRADSGANHEAKYGKASGKTTCHTGSHESQTSRPYETCPSPSARYR